MIHMNFFSASNGEGRRLQKIHSTLQGIFFHLLIYRVDRMLPQICTASVCKHETCASADAVQICGNMNYETSVNYQFVSDIYDACLGMWNVFLYEICI